MKARGLCMACYRRVWKLGQLDTAPKKPAKKRPRLRDEAPVVVVRPLRFRAALERTRASRAALDAVIAAAEPDPTVDDLPVIVVLPRRSSVDKVT